MFIQSCILLNLYLLFLISLSYSTFLPSNLSFLLLFIRNLILVPSCIYFFQESNIRISAFNKKFFFTLLKDIIPYSIKNKCWWMIGQDVFSKYKNMKWFLLVGHTQTWKHQHIFKQTFKNKMGKHKHQHLYSKHTNVYMLPPPHHQLSMQGYLDILIWLWLSFFISQMQICKYTTEILMEKS